MKTLLLLSILFSTSANASDLCIAREIKSEATTNVIGQLVTCPDREFKTRSTTGTRKANHKALTKLMSAEGYSEKFQFKGMPRTYPYPNSLNDMRLFSRSDASVSYCAVLQMDYRETGLERRITFDASITCSNTATDEHFNSITQAELESVMEKRRMVFVLQTGARRTSIDKDKVSLYESAL